MLSGTCFAGEFFQPKGQQDRKSYWVRGLRIIKHPNQCRKLGKSIRGRRVTRPLPVRLCELICGAEPYALRAALQQDAAHAQDVAQRVLSLYQRGDN
jgi:hypothetical protein